MRHLQYSPRVRAVLSKPGPSLPYAANGRFEAMIFVRFWPVSACYPPGRIERELSTGPANGEQLRSKGRELEATVRRAGYIDADPGPWQRAD